MKKEKKDNCLVCWLLMLLLGIFIYWYGGVIDKQIEELQIDNCNYLKTCFNTSQ